MGERKGQNKYYPPDFDPKKHRSLDAYHGTHALRERARKLGQGILIIRFEMPYNIWCEGCKNPIGMGVRYNAEKSKEGMYYSTPIYKFRMKCHLCDNHFEIKTDPANHDYVIISGARRKEQRWDPKDNEQIVPEDKNDQKKLATDAMYKMEHGVDDKNKTQTAAPRISELASRTQRMKDDYDLNSLVRSQFREKKKVHKAQLEQDEALLSKYSLDVKLAPEDVADAKMAELLRYQTVMSYDDKQKEKRAEIASRPMFSSSSPASVVNNSSVIRGNKNKMARQTLVSAISRSKPVPFSSPSPDSSSSSHKSPYAGIVRNIKAQTSRQSTPAIMETQSTTETLTMDNTKSVSGQTEPDEKKTENRLDTVEHRLDPAELSSLTQNETSESESFLGHDSRIPENSDMCDSSSICDNSKMGDNFSMPIPDKPASQASSSLILSSSADTLTSPPTASLVSMYSDTSGDDST